MKLFFSWMTILYYSRRHNLFFGYDMTITLSYRSYRTIGVISFHFIGIGIGSLEREHHHWVLGF